MKYDRRALRALRSKSGLTRDELANRARLSERTLYFLERGVTEPKASTLAKLAQALGVSVEAFFERKDAA